MYKIIGLFLVAAIPLIGCAEKEDNSTPMSAEFKVQLKQPMTSGVVVEAEHTTELLDNGDAFVYSLNKRGSSKGTYITMLPADRKTMVERIIWILRKLNTESSFIESIESRLPKNRRIKKENFNLPLIDENGRVRNFVYTSDYDRKLFVLNFTEQN